MLTLWLPLRPRHWLSGVLTLWPPLRPRHWLSSAPRLCGQPQARAERARRACGRGLGHSGWSVQRAPGQAVPRTGGQGTSASTTPSQEAARHLQADPAVPFSALTARGHMQIALDPVVPTGSVLGFPLAVGPPDPAQPARMDASNDAVLSSPYYPSCTWNRFLQGGPGTGWDHWQTSLALCLSSLPSRVGLPCVSPPPSPLSKG